MVSIYIKIIVTMVISLFTVPVVLNALGASDYGLYNLVAGIVLMLSFLNGSMTVSTQRYLSVYMGAKDNKKLLQIFNVSIVLHLLVGFAVIVILELSSLFLFNHFLNIDYTRIETVKIVFQCLILSTFFTIVSVPFDALINSYEDFIPLSLIEIINSVFILILVLSINKINIDSLVFYSIGMAFITTIFFLMKFLYCKFQYQICKINLKYFDKQIFKEIFSFAGWNTYGAVAMMARNQGIAVVMNNFFGTVINAAYGIANQINNVISNFSITLQKTINPQLMKSEGENNREKMLNIAMISSRYSVYILTIISIPLIIEMPYILKLWLKEVPENTIIFSRLILVLSIIYQFSVGLMSAIQSAGKIKNYQIVIGTVLLLNILLAYIILKLKFPPYYVFISLIIIEIISLYIRIIFAKKLVNLDKKFFIKDVFIIIMIINIITISVSFLPTYILQESFLRLSITVLVSFITYCFLIYVLGLKENEKNMINNFVISLLKIEKK